MLYVSDSRGNDKLGPGIFRYSLETGEGGVWSATSTNFANGMAMTLDGSGLYVIESDAAPLSYVPIGADGSARTATMGDLHNVPDGVAAMPPAIRTNSPADNASASRWRAP
jgi:sugar lactone lactonase YvrE